MKDKILFITGASSDVGIEIIRKCRNNYKRIIAHYHNEAKQLDELKNQVGDKLITIQADFSEEEDVNRMINEMISAELFPNHIVHLSSPKFRIQKFHKEEINSFRSYYLVSVESIILILKRFLPYMTKQKYGKIVFALSQNVIGQPANYQSAYTIMKYALLGLMKSLSVEYADKGITVNAVSPNMIDTKFLSEIPEVIVQQNAEKMPQKKNLNVNEVAPLFGFLLSDEADRITGENIAITGGLIR